MQGLSQSARRFGSCIFRLSRSFNIDGFVLTRQSLGPPLQTSLLSCQTFLSVCLCPTVCLTAKQCVRCYVLHRMNFTLRGANLMVQISEDLILGARNLSDVASLRLA